MNFNNPGLTTEEVNQRIQKGLQNVNPKEKKGKTIGDIIFTNLFTFFNFLNAGFFALVLIAKSYKNGLFIIAIVVNTIIGIFQEIRTKIQLDKLKILTASHATVIRDGNIQKIAVKDLVLDDIMVLKTGDQIASDAVLLDGMLEVNESMLTGESDNVPKTPYLTPDQTGFPDQTAAQNLAAAPATSTVYSGSFVTSGTAHAKVIHVGKDNYVETISGEAKRHKKQNSELRNFLNKILKLISFIIVPLCAAMFIKAYFFIHMPFEDAVVSMVTSGIGMIPEGLILLTSVSLTVGVLKLARRKTVVQELFGIESLARVDVLCLGKTGTLTEGKMKVEEVVSDDPATLQTILQQLLKTSTDKNATEEALTDYFGVAKHPWSATLQIPFSSDRKYSGCSYENQGTFYIGAVQYLFPNRQDLHQQAQTYAKEGFRVITVTKSPSVFMAPAPLPADLAFLGFIILSDVIRKDCAQTLAFFKEQGVTLKCISGDDPVTVSKIAEKCGLDGAANYIDASTLTTESALQEALATCTVFGRVKPDQKKQMVQCLQQMGHTVAMTGDGVNDVLALRQADCSIAMAEGSDAAKNASNIVLLDSNFSSMPSVVNEGRRVINNICHSSSMYLIKTTFSILITLGTLLFGRYYPFDAVQFSVISACAVGIPTFFLQLEPSYQQIDKDFMNQVFRNALPTGVFIALICLLFTNIGFAIDPGSKQMLSTICIFCMGWIYFYILRRIFSPMSLYRRIIAYSMEVICILVMMFGQHVLELTSVNATGVLLIILVISTAPVTIPFFEQLYDKIRRKKEKK